ncbi:MAG: ADOP family duplicated permease [Vicinamibacterales bacterium]
MNWRHYVRAQLPPLTVEAEREAEIVDELAMQLEATFDRARANGDSEDAAIARAVAEVPDWRALARTLEAVHPPRATRDHAPAAATIISGISGDARFAMRSLRRTPAFTAVAVLTLAAGLGMVAAAFAVLDTVLIEPLRFQAPDRLVLVHATVPPDARDTNEVTYLDAMDLAAETSVFASVGVVIPYAGTASALDPPERIEGLELSPAMFDTLRVQPALGRAFTEAESRPGQPPVVILGHGFWQRLGGRADIIGQTFILDDITHTIVGVMPHGFRVEVLNHPDAIYRPVTSQHFAAGSRGFRAFRAIARLRDDVSIEQAQTVAAVVGNRLASAYSDTNRGRTFSLRPLQEDISAPVRQPLLLVAGLVALVLVIASVNLINLLIARALARARDVAVREALGAGAWRVARSSVVESLLLAAAGAVGGVVVAQLILACLLATPVVTLPRLHEIAFGGREIAVLAGAAIAITIAFGSIPFFLQRRLRDAAALKTGHETAGHFENRVRAVLAAAQTGLAFVLLVAAALLALSLQRVLSMPSGFESGVITMRVAAPAARYPTREATARFYTEFVNELVAQPVVQKAGFASVLPLSGNTGSSMTVQGREDTPMAARPEVGWQWASPGYFDAIGMRIVRGSGFTNADFEAASHVTLINETLARLHFNGEDPIGRRVYFGGVPPTGVPEWHEIIGVVGDVRHRSLEREPDARAYDLFGQHWGRTISLAVRSAESAPVVASTVRATLARRDARLAVFAVRSTDEIVSGAVAARRLLLWLVGVFAIAGFALALLGVYGIVACLVAERQREIGVRMALGATTANIHQLILGHGLKVAVTGLGGGLLAALALRRAIASQLFGIEPTNATALAAVAFGLLLAVTVPCVIVSQRATRLDPMRALRSE